jgi:hypothetical protein
MYSTLIYVQFDSRRKVSVMFFIYMNIKLTFLVSHPVDHKKSHSTN